MDTTEENETEVNEKLIENDSSNNLENNIEKSENEGAENASSESEIKSPASKKKTKKKKPFIFRFFMGIINFIFFLILLIAVWTTVHYFYKTEITEVISSDYSVHLRTDSVWDSVLPLVDLQAVDIVLSEPSFAPFKNTLIEFRQSPLRENKIVDLALSRRLDFMLYQDNDFIAVLDTGFLAGIVKLAPLALNFVTVPNLTVLKTDGKTYFTYEAGDNLIYICINKNLVIAASNQKLFESTFEKNKTEWTDAKRRSFQGKIFSPFAVTADSLKIISMFSDINNSSMESYINAVKSCIPPEELATVDFGITDQKLNLSIDIPYDTSALSVESPVVNLLKKESQIPSIVQKLPEFIQYYTVISVGSLQELKEAAFYVADKSMGLESKWKTAQNLSNVVFKETLENLFFSWTDDEYAVVGLEQKPDPVFVIKIKNEEKRRAIFDVIFNSIILKNDSSLILDNVRLPKMQLPDFLQGLLEAFGIRLPSPYYMVQDGFIYFSQSPENLASINAALKNGTRLTQNSIWRDASGKKSQYSSLSLFYNLERSIPFFLKANTTVSKILELYNVGRLDLRIKESVLEVNLSAVESPGSSSSVLTGFPVELGEKINSSLIKSNVQNSRTVFYSRGGTVYSYNLASQETAERKIDSLKFILAAASGTESQMAKEKPALWAVTKEGTVYLLDEKLKDVTGFPLITGRTPLSQGAAYKNGLLFCIPDQRFLQLETKRKGTLFEEEGFNIFGIDSFDDITTTPVVVDNNTFAFYERSFLGGIHVIKDYEEKLFDVTGIGFGSPAVSSKGNEKLIGFVSQSGLFHLMNPSADEEALKVQLEGVFYLNVKACGNTFVAVSEDGTLYSIKPSEIAGENPEIVRIKIPHLTARTGSLSVADFDNDGKEEIFVCGDGNVIYGFRENLELIGSFPVTGYGEPIFLDLDGNKKNECVCYSLDNKINGWKLIY